MKSKYKIVIVILTLLLILSIGSSFINYKISMLSTQKQLKTQSIPLSLDNIYTEIQKLIVHPYLISSMMAHDTFVIDWINNNENSTDKIQKYLESIKNKYSFVVAFLVSDKTKYYYTHKGYIEKVIKNRQRNQWYFDFTNSRKRSEINIDLNSNIAKNLIMFINFKIFDKDFHYLGATGVGIKLTYINEMLKMFKEKYKFNVKFFDKKGNFVLLSEEDKLNNIKNINDVLGLKKLSKILFLNEPQVVEYYKDGLEYLISTKFIPQLNAYLLVEAKLNDFTYETKKSFYISFIVSILFTAIISIILITFIRKNNNALERLATTDELTKLPNRRSFNEKLAYALDLNKRNQLKLYLLYIDIDDFKSVNDELGHDMGDKLLKEIANIIMRNTRSTDLKARIGGEEFVVVLINTDEVKDIAIKLKDSIEHSVEIRNLLDKKITVSCGITRAVADDNIDSILIRADKAMYKAKSKGKNRIEFN